MCRIVHLEFLFIEEDDADEKKYNEDHAKRSFFRTSTNTFFSRNANNTRIQTSISQSLYSLFTINSQHQNGRDSFVKYIEAHPYRRLNISRRCLLSKKQESIALASHPDPLNVGIGCMFVQKIRGETFTRTLLHFVKPANGFILCNLISNTNKKVWRIYVGFLVEERAKFLFRLYFKVV